VATTAEIKDLRRQAKELKEFIAEQAFELRLLKNVPGRDVHC
jgi:transposase